MPWTNKSKNVEASTTLKTRNAEASSTNKDKIEQQSDELEIRTPNNLQILVGSAEDLVLIYREGFNNWNLKAKIAS